MYFVTVSPKIFLRVNIPQISQLLLHMHIMINIVPFYILHNYII